MLVAARNEIQPRRDRRARGSGRAGEVGGGRIGLPVAAHQAAAFRSGRPQARGKGAHRLAVGSGAGVAAARRRVPLRSHRGSCGIPIHARCGRGPSCLPVRRSTADNRSRLFTTWLREPVPLPEKRPGPALLVLHAGETLPRFPVPTQALDLRTAPADLVAAYAIFRRYLFDYRVDLATPLWMLIDSAGRVRKVYADTPAASVVAGRSAHGGRAGAGCARAAVRRRLPRHAHARLFQDRRRHVDGGLRRAGAAVPGRGICAAPRTTPRRCWPSAASTCRRTAWRRRGRRWSAPPRWIPGLPEAWNDLGGVESAAGNPREALRLYERALALGPDLPYALVNAGADAGKAGQRRRGRAPVPACAGRRSA